MADLPTVQAFLLAEAIYQDAATGKHVVAGTFNRVAVPAVPCNLTRPVQAFIALHRVPPELQIALRFVTDAGEVLVRSSTLSLRCADPRQVIERAVPIPALPLPGLGWYRVELLLDDKVAATVALEVVGEPRV